MNAAELQKLIDEIEGLVADAQVAPNYRERVEYLRQALVKACKYVKRLNRQIAQIVSAVMAEGEFDPARQALPLKDIVGDDPQLEVFRQKRYLLDFLYASKDLLEGDMRFTRARIGAAMKQVELSYNEFMEEKIAVNPVVEQFQKLESYFCRPPWGNPGGSLVGPHPKDDGPSGVTRSREETVCRWLGTLATVGTFLYPIIEKIIGQAGSATEPVTTDSRTYPHRVLALALTSGMASELEKAQELAEVGVLAFA